MDCVRGQIMRSLKGHDKGDFQVVLKTDGAYAYMADGKRRRMEAPKKKKLMHLAPTATVLVDVLEIRNVAEIQLREHVLVHEL